MEINSLRILNNIIDRTLIFGKEHSSAETDKLQGCKLIKKRKIFIIIADELCFIP